ncbi:MAG TPA: M48 family metallopeptidase [Candidatus Krumholzibacteria bacterium]|nr:M48 family metallopeptidase [Candidatus Krumholzibacteria bacterium]HPD71846.1 M48 family metallopeptidase [Candidatus Krumholzibacteria bacterium]HRY41221.1 M48 family metallopeptidase [Candidatus Krumholzibacteria bacterium]
MKYDQIRVRRETEFSDDLRGLFNADLIEGIIRESKVEGEENWLLALMHGHGLKITAALAPRIFEICEQVKKALGFTDGVEFFVQGDSSLNCSAVPRFEADQPHLVIINSGLLERFTDAELRFVLGHELGHLVSRNSELQRIVRFIFPDGDGIPLAIRDKVEVWEKLAEMSADRFGYLAEPDLDVCLAVFFKLSSGLDTKAIRFDPGAYLQEMDRVLERFRTEMADVGVSHPINPLRVKALQMFAGSRLYAQLARGKDASEDRALTSALEDLVQILLTKGHSPLVTARRRFLAAAGFLVANADRQVDPDELDAILEPLANFTHFPAEYFRHVLEDRDVKTVFHESAGAILAANPGERFPMFNFMVQVVLADRRLEKREIELLFEVGENLFRFQRKEIAQMLAEALQKEFVPRLSPPPAR